MKLNENGDVKKSSRIKEMGGGVDTEICFSVSVFGQTSLIKGY